VKTLSYDGNRAYGEKVLQHRGLISGRKGQAAIFMTMTLTLSMGLIGLVVDIGWAYWRKEACATAANAAAFAAIAAASSATNQSCGSGTAYWDCSTYNCPANPILVTNNFDNGCLYAKQNGFLNTGRQTVTVQGGTTAAPAPGLTPAYWVKATVTEKIPTLFSAVLGQPLAQIAMQSTAGLFKGSGGGCVYVLNSNSTPGAYTQSGGSFTSGCGVTIDSSASNALLMSGGTLALTGGGNLSIVGNKSTSGGSITFGGGGSLLTGQAGSGNPVSGLTAPTPAGSCLADPGYSGSVNNITVPSGTYCGITNSGSTGMILSGTYIMKTGSFIMSGGNMTTAAGGATIYFPPSNSGTIMISGGTLGLTAPTSGSLAGIAIWDNNTLANSMNISGGSFVVNGIIDMPNTAMTYSGGGTPVQQTLIVNTLIMSGGNISQPATSSFFSNGATLSGKYIIQ
jgi:Flp pilus assembly protein TadG